MAFGGLVYTLTNARFTIQDVQVSGAQVLRADEVITLADARNESIWYVDTDTIIERLRSNAYIEEASARVMLPDRLLLTIVERRPEVRWSSGGAQYVVDSKGRVLGSEATGTLTNTLVIQDQSQRVLQPNDYVDTDAVALAQVLALKLPGEYNLQPASINWDFDRGVYVLTVDQRTIIFGRGDRLDEKLTVLGTVLSDGTAFTFLDLRPKTPYYRNETGDENTAAGE
jgi:cell division protein FtsQ